MAAQTIQSTTQQFLDIYDITNDILIMKDGAASLIISVNAINFGLLAEEEQDAVIYSYAGLLNSLNYPIQIVIRSQTKDVTNYLNLLKTQEEQAATQLKRDQISRYREFVNQLIRERNVLDKKFYVVIPASALEMGLLPPSTVIPGVKQPDISTIEKSLILEKARNILEPKCDHLISQFGRIGLIARQLTTQEIIQLFYLSYNPEAAEGQQITETRDYTLPLVSAQVQTQDIPANPAAVAQPPVAPAPVVEQTQEIAVETPPIDQTQPQFTTEAWTPPVQAEQPAPETIAPEVMEPTQPSIEPMTLDSTPLPPMPDQMIPAPDSMPVAPPTAAPMAEAATSADPDLPPLPEIT